MKKISIILFTTLFFISCKNKIEKPNIVFVFADQWRAESLGYAGNPDVKTPNIDQLASEGVYFTNAISTEPVCTPYRAMLLTGQYPLKTGMFMNDILLDPTSESFAKLFKKQGYNTAYIGKWHLDGNGRSAFIPKERRQGFDYWKVLECSHTYNNSTYWGNDDELHSWEGYDAEAQTKDAITYIEEQSKSKKPFSLVLSWGPPHAPYQTAPKEFQDLYTNVDIKLRPNVPEEFTKKAKKTLKGYYAHCSALDSYIKQLQDAIKRCNIEENTIFVFTSDHGDMIYSHGETKKQRIYNESAKVPFIIKYPALFGTNGKKSDFLLNSLDILPTMLGMSGLNIPANLDGEDITDVLLGKKEDTRKASLVTCIQPFGQWSRARGGKEFRGVITKKYTYAKDLSGDWLLFDNVSDPYQLKNLKGDPAFESIIKNLEETLTEELKRMDDEFLTGSSYVEKWEHSIDSTGTVPYKW
ncbi:sulfatase family protein [Saccharicrinis fermentans]|uniref:Arylsulfatase n=1 Tax=Saccharicrinis fermentans DSM 9555 = JCM 21142 TaxID=869213 RepID=W7YL69_9BACT|nr:sulfatase [Saccharicrinis fermentans]GAF05291.1 arylsulfatase [Saccharicrinis fermentans DSM 9555 = JCM 21142]